MEIPRIVIGHGGFVRVESRPQSGTAFEVFLPALAEAVSRPREGTAGPVPAGGGELILLVDDEAAICRFALGVLQRAGYRCVCAGNGQEAMELFHQHRDEIQLVVTDLMMPVMGGDLAIRAMMQVRADLRFIAMSGLLEQEVVAGLPKERIRLLPKPFAGEDILTAVRESIGVHGARPPVAGAQAESSASSPKPGAGEPDGPSLGPSA